ncbi:hypothetical protein BDZ91DRAFT_715284 [Kalaharituber pfeilii]|nr:hypothetical protein BDZ91DRAFT_715284 [Kalaharituber pfeilii]
MPCQDVEISPRSRDRSRGPRRLWRHVFGCIAEWRTLYYCIEYSILGPCSAAGGWSMSS